MSYQLDRNEAEAEAARVLRDYNQLSPPIDPFGIAKAAGIYVAAMNTQEQGVSGYFQRVGGVFGIQYSSTLPNEGFIRFTVAHELGHYFISGHAEQLFQNGDGVHKSYGEFTSDDRLERQANIFASALLMPHDHFIKEMWRGDADLDGIIRLAELFKTSLTATTIKYACCAEIPFAMIMSSGQTVEYCIMSEALKNGPHMRWAKKGDALSKQTATFRLNERISTDAACKRLDGECSLDDWFEDAPDVTMTEEALNLGTYGKTLTVIYTDEDLEELLEDEAD